MILGINGIRLIGKGSGVARCIEAILRCLGDLEHPFNEIRVYTPSPLSETTYLPTGAVNVVLPSPLPPAFWEQLILPLAHGRRGLLLCPSYVVPLGAFSPTFLIHHGSYEGYPQGFSWWRRNRMRVIYGLSARRATGVSTVSEYSRRDMVRYYGLRAKSIHVVPEGVDTKLFRPLDDRAALASWRADILGADVPFLSYVGKPTERRNLTALIRAFGILKTRYGVPHRLLIVGADLPGDSPFRRVIAELGLEHDVVVRGYASHAEMVFVYNSTDVFVYPSSYEGFGMPVLEAMACGAPVVAMNNTAFPEFAGGVARLLPDARVETLVGGIWEALSDPAWRARAAVEGPGRARTYDWHLVTRRYLDFMVPLAQQWEARSSGDTRR